MKPLDFGGDGITGSVNADGRLIALNFYHPQHGYVTLTSAEPFPESERYNPEAVRAYRASLVEQDGFGVRCAAPITGRSGRLRESTIPEIELQVTDGIVRVTTIGHGQKAVQFIDAAPGLSLRWVGTLCLQRCAYTQLTEGGPLPMPPLRMRAYTWDGLLIIQNSVLGAFTAIAGLDVSSHFEIDATPYPLELDFPLKGGTVAYGVGLTAEEAIAHVRGLVDHASVDASVTYWRERLHGLPDDPLVRRGVAYALMNAVPVDVPTGEGICLLTDHMLLPLSWNRDAYFAARALLSAGQTDIVRRHLLWVFETAERQDGAWGRCYLANGRVKDRAYQLDQQVYPLLELAEYVLETGDQATAERLHPQIDGALAALDARRLPDVLLFPTDETPADDPIALPYHFSSHVLIWHMLNKLKVLGAAHLWTERLPKLRETIQRTFITEYEGRQIYAYAADNSGRFHLYHDANDFPMALAVTWGFVAADDPVWRATLDFAFSEANAGGFYAGHLGSVHSRAPWALGDIQELIIALSLGDNGRAERARASLRRAAQIDGALPEAYDAESGAVISRHWFVWTNAALACVELGAFD